MHLRRIASFVLGVWLGGSVFLAFVAMGNFATVNSVLANPAPLAARLIQPLGPERSRELLRSLVGEENRRYFQTWELAQFGLGLILGAVLLLDRRSWLLPSLCGIMLSLVAFLHFRVTPEMVWLQRTVEFIPDGVSTPERTHFMTLHHVYSTIEVIKILLGLAIAGILFTIRPGRRHRSRTEHAAIPPLERRG
ncbi:MAG: hypothetical protein ACRD4P_02545 [Bryobacteraceae bacterium]